jgi:hypothetical protein
MFQYVYLMIRTIYLVAAILGIILPMIQFIPASVAIPLAGTFFIGFSFGLPFFLYLRERALEASREVKT